LSTKITDTDLYSKKNEKRITTNKLHLNIIPLPSYTLSNYKICNSFELSY